MMLGGRSCKEINLLPTWWAFLSLLLPGKMLFSLFLSRYKTPHLAFDIYKGLTSFPLFDILAWWLTLSRQCLWLKWVKVGRCYWLQWAILLGLLFFLSTQSQRVRGEIKPGPVQSTVVFSKSETKTILQPGKHIGLLVLYDPLKY